MNAKTDKAPSRSARRLRRGAVIAGLAGAALVALPSTAFASQSYSGPVAYYQAVCRNQFANYQVRMDGSADRNVSFTVYKNGNLLDWRVVSAAAFEYRTSFGTFPGPGTYKICATNNVAGSPTAKVVINVRTDAEI